MGVYNTVLQSPHPNAFDVIAGVGDLLQGSAPGEVDKLDSKALGYFLKSMGVGVLNEWGAIADLSSIGFGMGWTVTKDPPESNQSVAFGHRSLNIGLRSTNDKIHIISPQDLTIDLAMGLRIEFFGRRDANAGGTVESYAALVMSETDLITNPTRNHIGFKHINNMVWASNANNTSQTLTDTGVRLSSVVALAIEIVSTFGPTIQEIRYYAEDVLVARHTTNLPGPINYTKFIYSTKGTTNALRSIYWSLPVFTQLLGASSRLLMSFMQSDVAAAQTDVALDVLGLAGNKQVVATHHGSVIGISIASNTPRTAGTLTVDITINGTPTGLQAVLDVSNTQFHYDSQAMNLALARFVPGDRIGVEVTTDASWAPTTADIVVNAIIQTS